MASVLNIGINPTQMRLLRERLSPKQVRIATVTAVKRTATTIRKEVSDRIRKRINLKAGSAKEYVLLIPPKNEANPTATIRIAKKPVAVWDFAGVRDTQKSGVYARFMKDRPPIRFPHYFLAVMPSGHMGVFGRTKHIPTTGRNAGGGNLTRSGFAQRLAIQEVYGPSAYSLLVRHKQLTPMMQQVMAMIGPLLQKNIAGQFYRFAKQRMPGFEK